MTTIATDGRSMAGDSQTSNGPIFGYGEKVFRTPDGRLYGCCGDSSQCIKLARWIESGGDFPVLNDKVSALILNLDGTADWIDEDGELVRVMTPAAIGSGGDFAIGAIEAGRSPDAAVEIAAKRDTGTGGKITILHLDKVHMQAVA